MNDFIGFIPLRGGSKGIKNKNIKDLNGKPMCYYSICALQNSRYIKKVVVSTDCDKIKAVVLSFNFNKVEIFERSSKNASDTASSESAILEYLKSDNILKNNFLFFCQATSPLLTPDIVNDAIKKFQKCNYDSMVSVVDFTRFFWDQDSNPINYDPKSRPRRQEMKTNYVENGAFYISKNEQILDTECRISGKIGLFEMPLNTIIEIDELKDFKLITNILKYAEN